MHMTPDEVSAAELLSFLRELADSCVNDANALKFEKAPRRHVYTASAYGTIVELSLGILALVEKHELTSLSVFLRSFLEANASFRYCANDPNHSKSMYASFMKERLHLAHTAVAQRKEPSLKKVSQSIDVRSKKAASNRRLGEIK
jgi:hypothetical protein